MNDITKAGLLLNGANIPCSIFRMLCRDYSPEELLAGESFWDILGMTPQQKIRLSALLTKDSWPERELDLAYKMGVRFITALDEDYPEKLLDLNNPPVGLYIKGSVNLSSPSVSIVGTRHPSSYGQTAASNLGRALASEGVIVVSGGARGIDSSSHRGVLANDGVTIAVFGTGIDKVYPVENRDLFQRITERGAVVTEYSFGTSGEGWRFVERNRIIAALSAKTVIVESPQDGGAMHTARMALKLGREVWAVPGRIDDKSCKGSNSLFVEGAKPLVSIEDFVNLSSAKHEQFTLNFDEPGETLDLPQDERAVYSLLEERGARMLDELVTESGLDFGSVSMALMTLEADGLITNSAGRYSIKA